MDMVPNTNNTENHKPDEKQTAPKVPFAVVEAYKTIRTNLMFLLSQNPGCKSFVISSPSSCEGKTTTAINSAIAFSQLGKKVVLIDADMRRPSVFKKLHISNSTGLSNLLAGFSTLEEVIMPVSSSFDVIPAGPTPPNPSEILASKAMDRLLDTLKQSYDYIILDTPPLGIVTDALLTAPKTDGIIVVIKERTTTYDEFHKIMGSIELANARMLGVVLNAAEVKARRYRYSSYSAYK